MKKLAAVMTAVLMGLTMILAALGCSVTALAAGAGTITVTPPAGTGKDVQTTYKLYKVFVASGNGTGIRYNTVNTGDVVTDSNGNILTASKGSALPDIEKVVGESYSETETNHFIFDTTGGIHWGTIKEGATSTKNSEWGDEVDTYEESYINDVTSESLPDYAIAAIKNYIANDKPIQTVTATGTNPVLFTNVDNGYYYITTSTGTAVSITSANPNANVEDKNVDPTLEKVITGVDIDSSADASSTGQTGTTSTVGSVSSDGRRAIAENGSVVTYQVTVHFNNGAENVILHDKLDESLRLTNTDPVIAYFAANGASETLSEWKAGVRRNADGTTGNNDDPDSGDTITIDFTGITANISSATVTYSATVESGKLTSVNPAKNAAFLSYGTGNPQAQTSKVNTYVYNATYKVTKTDQANQPLAGAGFLLRKTETVGSTTKSYYYKRNDNDSGKGEVSWVEVTQASGQTPENAARAAAAAGTITQLTTTEASNVITFTGLADGTYELYELTVPTGYIRAADVQFTIRAANDITQDTDDNIVAFTSANLEQETTVTNRPGSALPTTGGIGTTIFYVIGGCLVAGAVVLLIVRKKKKA